MPDIVLYIQPGFRVPGHQRCFSGTPFAIKIARLLRFKRLAFAVTEIGWLERSERLPRISGSGKLPVLEYDGERFEDSTEIAYFVESRHPQPALIPEDPLLRARCHFIEEWADEALYWYGIYEQRRFSASPASDAAYFAELPEELRSPAVERLRTEVEENLKRQGIGRYPADKVQADVRRGLDSLVALIEVEGFVAGKALSLADIALLGQFERRLAGTNPWLQSEFGKREALVDWYERVAELTGERL